MEKEIPKHILERLNHAEEIMVKKDNELKEAKARIEDLEEELDICSENNEKRRDRIAEITKVMDNACLEYDRRIKEIETHKEKMANILNALGYKVIDNDKEFSILPIINKKKKVCPLMRQVVVPLFPNESDHYKFAVCIREICAWWHLGGCAAATKQMFQK